MAVDLPPISRPAKACPSKSLKFVAAISTLSGFPTSCGSAELFFLIAATISSFAIVNLALNPLATSPPLVCGLSDILPSFFICLISSGSILEKRGSRFGLISFLEKYLSIEPFKTSETFAPIFLPFGRSFAKMPAVRLSIIQLAN